MNFFFRMNNVALGREPIVTLPHFESQGFGNLEMT